MLKIFSKLSKRERFIIYFLLAAVFVMLFDRLVLSPVTKRMDALNSEITVQEKKLIKSLRILQQEDLVSAEFNENVKQIKQEGSDEEEMMSFQSSIERLAKKTNLVIINMQPSDIYVSELYKKYTVKVDAEAAIARLADFIYQLERSPQFIRVSEFSLSLAKGSPAVLKIYMLLTKITLEGKAE